MILKDTIKQGNSQNCCIMHNVRSQAQVGGNLHWITYNIALSVRSKSYSEVNQPAPR